MSELTAIVRGTSALDPANPANYKPIVIDWQVQVKHGRGWRIMLNRRGKYAGEVLTAVSLETGYRTVRVRAADHDDHWHVMRRT